VGGAAAVGGRMPAAAVPATPVLVVMGVSGVGKTTLAAAVAAELGWAFAEGDALHPEANVAKMAAGTPLSDDDRAPWLARVAGWIDDRIAAGEPGVVTCSALKRGYRDVLRRAEVVFVHLTGPRALTAARLAARPDHFMPPVLLDSQLDTLEPLAPDEQSIDVSTALTRPEQLAAVTTWLGRR
jgi:gluconokinase